MKYTSNEESCTREDLAFHSPLMTEEQLAAYLKMPELSSAQNYKGVIDNLVRHWDLPCGYLYRKRVFYKPAVDAWLAKKCEGRAA